MIRERTAIVASVLVVGLVVAAVFKVDREVIVAIATGAIGLVAAMEKVYAPKDGEP